MKPGAMTLPVTSIVSLRREAAAHAHDLPVGDGDVGVVHLAGKHVDDLSALEQQISGCIPARDFDKLTQFHSLLNNSHRDTVARRQTW